MIRAGFIGVLLVVSGCVEPVEAPTLPLSSTPVFAPEVKLPEYTGDGSLAGHTWQVGEVTFSFQRGNHLLVRGGHLDETMPTGAPGRYTIEETSVKLDVLNREYEGQWQDTVLTIQENTGIYLGLTAEMFPASDSDETESASDDSGEQHEEPSN